MMALSTPHALDGRQTNGFQRSGRGEVQ